MVEKLSVPARQCGVRRSQDATHPDLAVGAGGETRKVSEPLEKQIETAIRVALTTEGVMVMKHHVDNRGQRPCPVCGHQDAARGARTGLGLGVADLVCVVPPTGRLLAIEVKRPSTRKRLRDDQERWLAVVRRFGGVTGVAASVSEAEVLLREARS